MMVVYNVGTKCGVSDGASHFSGIRFVEASSRML